MKGPLQIAEAAWGHPLPDWVRALALACAQTNQARVARVLGRSDAVVSQVLRNKYGAETARIEERVRGLYLNGVVLCPEQGELPTNECQDWREKAGEFLIGNPMRIRMFHACRACPRNAKPERAAEA
jgi:hypothetical protein